MAEFDRERFDSDWSQRVSEREGRDAADDTPHQREQGGTGSGWRTLEQSKVVRHGRDGGRVRRPGSGPLGRLLRIVVLLGAIYGVVRWKFDPQYLLFQERFRMWWYETNYQKEVRFEGLRTLRPEDLEVRIPMERSVWWWLRSGTEIELLLSRDPVVASARIERCSTWSIRCFVLTVSEREPILLASVSNQWWVVGRDGAMIGVVSTDGRSNSNLPVLLGLGRFEAVPQLLGERVGAAVQLLGKLQSLTSEAAPNHRASGGGGEPSLPKEFSPKVLSFTGDQEILVEPIERELAPELLFDASSSEAINEQLRRGIEVVSQLAGRLTEARRIDLALKAQAVVSFKEKDAVKK